MSEHLLTESEAADRLRISKRSLRTLRLTGKLTYISRRPIRILERDLDAYIESLRIKATSTAPLEPLTLQERVAAAEADARSRGLKTMLRQRLAREAKARG